MYDYKKLQELAWFVLVTGSVAVLQVVLEAESILDYKTWLLAASSAGVRAGVGALLAVLTKPKS